MSKYVFPVEFGNDILDYIKSLEQRIKTLEKNTRLASVEPTGGSFVFYGADGVTKIVEIGDQPTTDRGSAFYRDDASPALLLSRLVSTDTDQNLRLMDRSGQVIFQESPDGDGIASPKFTPGHFYPISSASQVTTTSTTFVDMFKGRFRKQNSTFKVVVELNTSGSGVQAEVQLRDSFFGELTGTLISHTNGTTVTQYETPSFLSGTFAFMNFGDERDYFLQGRISSGSGTLTARVLNVMGD